MSFLPLAAWIGTDPHTGNLKLWRVELIGINAKTGQQVLMTLALLVLLFVIARILKSGTHWLVKGWKNRRASFWIHQAINVLLAILLIVGIISIWVGPDTHNLTTFAGLVTAGIAFALQQVITALAGYIVILRGRNFTVGDRIVMGGVRGDVIALGFIQTTIMEMGEPPATQSADPAVWVKARQYTGRIVTISNAKIFTEPVFNYTREFPYIWEELTLPISYKDDRHKAEQILLESARTHSVDPGELNQEAVEEMKRRYGMDVPEMVPKVYLRLTDNWIELTVRFITREHGVREVKNQMSRDILTALDDAGIGIASSTYDIVGMPPLRIVHEEPGGRRALPGNPGTASSNGPGQAG